MTAHSEHPVLRAYMWGSFANLLKMALWWTALGPLTYALLGSTAAIGAKGPRRRVRRPRSQAPGPSVAGVGRIVYNMALCLFSPVGGICAERVPPHKLLLRAAFARCAAPAAPARRSTSAR
jgi:hypothetical protein